MKNEMTHTEFQTKVESILAIVGGKWVGFQKDMDGRDFSTNVGVFELGGDTYSIAQSYPYDTFTVYPVELDGMRKHNQQIFSARPGAKWGASVKDSHAARQLNDEFLSACKSWREDCSAKMETVRVSANNLAEAKRQVREAFPEMQTWHETASMKGADIRFNSSGSVSRLSLDNMEIEKAIKILRFMETL